MKIGIIGLGDIAQKAYLPIITSMEGIELVLCTRNEAVLKRMSDKYRIKESVSSVEELIRHNIDAAFIHTATISHIEIAEMLLNNNIDVYVDKPLAYSYSEVAKLAEISSATGKIIFTGFNRRFAPMIKGLKEYGSPDVILVQKNRLFEPGDPRVFVFDDFIHVVDTLRFLMDSPILDMKVSAKLKEGKLYSLILQLVGEDCTAIGIMNRDSGATEEIVEYMTSGKKFVVKDFDRLKRFENGLELHERFNTWENTLYKRGFPQIMEHFINSVKNHAVPNQSINDSLITHQICERVLEEVINLI